VLDGRVTTHAYHLFSMRYDRAGWSGLARDAFVAALQAEGGPASAGYPYPIYKNALFADRPHRVLPCPHAEAHCQAAVWLPHNALLADEVWIDQVLQAIRKVRGAIGDLAAKVR
jgi:dTDP-4-amino-4,6-dideoxygalactose transaminase